MKTDHEDIRRLVIFAARIAYGEPSDLNGPWKCDGTNFLVPVAEIARLVLAVDRLKEVPEFREIIEDQAQRALRIMCPPDTTVRKCNKAQYEASILAMCEAPRRSARQPAGHFMDIDELYANGYEHQF